MTSVRGTKNEGLTAARAALLVGACALGVTWSYLAGQAGSLAAEAFAAELPANCEATRTTSGYTVACSESLAAVAPARASEPARSAARSSAPVTYGRAGWMTGAL